MDKLFSKQNNRIVFIIITMFLNFLGFSIIIPILPFLVQKYVSNVGDVALFVGLIMSAYAFCQFIAAPGLGALSDKYGRRPILLFSLFGSIIGYLVLGVGGALWVLFLGRIIDGITGGNISTVFAYIADITKPQDRGKFYGILGAAGGFGFMIGPAVGGFVGGYNLVAPLYLAAVITLINLVWGYFVLPESLDRSHRTKEINLTYLNPLLQFNHIFGIVALRRIFLFSFLFFLALMQMQGISSVFMKDVFSWNPAQIGFVLFLVGLIDIIAQGYLVTKLLPIFGDVKVSAIGLVLMCVGLLMIAAVSIFVSPVLLYLGVIVMILGDGLFEPSANGLISNSVDHTMQGRVQGANQGMQSIARVIGPLVAAFLYQYWRGLPYAEGAFLVFLALLVLIYALPSIKSHKIENPTNY